MTINGANIKINAWYNKHMNKPAKYDVVLEPQSSGSYTVYVPDLPGCVSEARTKSEALAMIADAISGYLAVRAEQGWNLPKVEHQQVTLA